MHGSENVRMEGRFMLYSVTPWKSRVPIYEGGKDTGRYEMKPSASVVFMAVKDDLFGSATPSGKIEMQVANPPVAQMLMDLWADHLRDREAAEQPRFRVTFELLTDPDDYVSAY